MQMNCAEFAEKCSRVNIYVIKAASVVKHYLVNRIDLAVALAE